MAYIYRYKDPLDGITKYVGIVWGETRTLQDRINEHQKEDWCKDKSWIIEYITEDIDNKSEAEAFESHFIALYNPCYNVAKVGWGINKYLPDRLNDWQVYNKNDFIKQEIQKGNSVDANERRLKYLNNKINSCKKCIENNKKSYDVINYVLNAILNKKYYITKPFRWTEDMPESLRNSYEILIRKPDFLDINDILHIEFKTANETGTRIVVDGMISIKRIDAYFITYGIGYCYDTLYDCVHSIVNTVKYYHTLTNTIMSDDYSALENNIKKLKEECNYININKEELFVDITDIN